MEISEKDLKAMLKEHQATSRLINAAFEQNERTVKILEALLNNPDPKPRQRRNLKDARVDQYAEAVAAGTWRKPIELRKKKLTFLNR